MIYPKIIKQTKMNKINSCHPHLMKKVSIFKNLDQKIIDTMEKLIII